MKRPTIHPCRSQQLTKNGLSDGRIRPEGSVPNVAQSAGSGLSGRPNSAL